VYLANDIARGDMRALGVTTHHISEEPPRKLVRWIAGRRG